ncbi:hypothetical protein GCM10008937_22290 [Deinococcus depolymerans]|uniref:Uncharacterized protein n=1 Tax=Deinococcus depolymerans TaxID=392408 RepID=A0ABN1C9H9_9DEIO
MQRRGELRVVMFLSMLSHGPSPQAWGTLESGCAERFAKLDTPWTLEREVDLVPVPGGVILPDFRLVQGDRSVWSAPQNLDSVE